MLKRGIKTNIHPFFKFYLIYFLVMGVLFFCIVPPKRKSQQAQALIQTDERGVLVDDIKEAWRARLDLIDSAETSLDIAYFAMQGGKSVAVFYAAILNAADRGVHVRFLMDGLMHGMISDIRVIQAFQAHPNISFRFYEPFDPAKPWTLQNRLHEKMIIVDGKHAMSGGRNIGDRYFSEASSIKTTSFDRDLMLLGTEKKTVGLVQQISAYFNELWQFKGSKEPKSAISALATESSIRKTEDHLAQLYQDYHQTPAYLDQEIDWWERSVKIEQGSFIHNGVKRFYKEPVVWQSLVDMLAAAEATILWQSPYVIMDHWMQKDMEKYQFAAPEKVLITNGIKVSPNLLAQAGYQNQRARLMAAPIDLYEYQSKASSLHTKTLVTDHNYSAVGTFNIDPRSANLHTESMLLIKSEELANEITDVVKKTYLPDCELANFAQKQWGSRWKHAIILLIRPLARLFERLL